MINENASIATFLEESASRKPTPGGGAVSAMAGALAASMGEMVLQYSVGKKGLEAHTKALTAALAELHRARLLLLGLMKEDQSAYEALTSARKPPTHKRTMAAALLACITVPQTIAATAVSILEVCDTIVEIVNPYLLSDLAVCADLAMATARCAMHNVRVNLNDVSDPKRRKAIEESSGKMLGHALVLVQRVGPKIAKRMGVK
jgi:formiminotetrahydrofolate cyclodeaminase